ncbi:hypothetical protein UFOVP1304_33 [uncultured Caudovirales phage]|uniref:Uncharacterized protein n=1 Tax=uncultured Caudovirales phage TaxID=2100421 RepID=A0A6J5RJF8_9CAUD|nr:hypothetical protein UFOVP1304_33 [uncultured Caudovirales phage]
MAYTFGGTTGDHLTWTESASPWGITARSGIIAGWYRPTTLTAGRALWSVGGVNRAEIATTTSEIKLVLDRATTDTEWTTTGLGLAVNQWHFVAVLQNNFNTGPVTNFRVWSSVGTDIPTAVTVAQTIAGAGNTINSTVVTAGNVSAAGATAFQGQIGRFDYVVGVSASSLIGNTNGSIGTENERIMFEQVVVPIWAGYFPTFYGSGTQSNNGITHVVWDLDVEGTQSGGNATLIGAGVRNGGGVGSAFRDFVAAVASPSIERRPIPQQTPLKSYWRRR